MSWKKVKLFFLLSSSTAVDYFHVLLSNFYPNKDECLSDKNFGRNTQYVAKFTKRWHFSLSMNKCVQFHYSGSGGNANNFIECADCLRRCLKVWLNNLVKFQKTFNSLFFKLFASPEPYQSVNPFNDQGMILHNIIHSSNNSSSSDKKEYLEIKESENDRSEEANCIYLE